MATDLEIQRTISDIEQLLVSITKIDRSLEKLLYRSVEVPQSFHHLRSELFAFTNTLGRIRKNIDPECPPSLIPDAISTVVFNFQTQTASLEKIIRDAGQSINLTVIGLEEYATMSSTHDIVVSTVADIVRENTKILENCYIDMPQTAEALANSKSLLLGKSNAGDPLQLRRWMSAPDPTGDLKKAFNQHHIGSGRWFLESSQYATWKVAHSSFLWLYGIPGSGKTILSSIIIQRLLKDYGDDPGTAVVYFYFDFKDEQKQNPQLMLHSLILQLSQQCATISASLEDRVSHHRNGQQQIPLPSAVDLLQHMVAEFPQVYIILDALDECSQSARLRSILETIATWRLPNLRLLVTSRTDQLLDGPLEVFKDTRAFVCLESQLVDEDIKKYVRSKLSSRSFTRTLPKWKKYSSTMTEIENALVEGSHGMFRWAACQLDSLHTYRTKVTLRRLLTSLPPTLEETYDRILGCISEDDSIYAIRLIRWLTFSVRPLLVKEVCEVVAIDVDRDPYFGVSEVPGDPHKILSICSSLVALAPADKDLDEQQVMLAHHSVKEYLFSKQCREGPAARYSMIRSDCNDLIARSCIAYLLQFQTPGQVTMEALKRYKLARYAAEFWFRHAQEVEEQSEALKRSSIELLSAENSAFRNWLRIYDPDRPRREPRLDAPYENFPPPLYYAARLGLNIVEDMVRETKPNLNAHGGYYGTALQAASAEGHEHVVRILLSKEIDIHAQSGIYGNALQAAAARGHKQLISLLLSSGFDVNVRGGRYGSAIQAASAEGHVQVVERLLENDANVNTQGGCYGSALQAASVKGHMPIVEHLIEKGADINMQGGYHSTALQAATYSGFEEIVKLLLKKGADVNAEFRNPSALSLAAIKQDRALLEILLAAGADIEMALKTTRSSGIPGPVLGPDTFLKQTAICYFAVTGNEEMVKRMIDLGADVNRPSDSDLKTPLHFAGEGGHLHVLRTLLIADADPTKEDQLGRTVYNYVDENAWLSSTAESVKREIESYNKTFRLAFYYTTSEYRIKVQWAEITRKTVDHILFARILHIYRTSRRSKWWQFSLKGPQSLHFVEGTSTSYDGHTVVTTEKFTPSAKLLCNGRLQLFHHVFHPSKPTSTERIWAKTIWDELSSRVYDGKGKKIRKMSAQFGIQCVEGWVVEKIWMLVSAYLLLVLSIGLLWSFLLKETEAGFAIAGCLISAASMMVALVVFESQIQPTISW